MGSQKVESRQRLKEAISWRGRGNDIESREIWSHQRKYSLGYRLSRCPYWEGERTRRQHHYNIAWEQVLDFTWRKANGMNEGNGHAQQQAISGQRPYQPKRKKLLDQSKALPHAIHFETKALINGYNLAVDALILHNLVDNYCEKSPNKPKMKMVITILEVWPNDSKLN